MDKKNHSSLPAQAWIIAVSMGYGHQRTAYPLHALAPDGKVIYANDYPDIPESDKRIWNKSRSFYEFISRFRSVPWIGDFTFRTYDRFQKILKFYPRRDLSAPTIVLKSIFKLIQKGWGKHLIETLSKNPLPIVTTFFTPAFMAETFQYPGDIYCVICDTDVSRAWVPVQPQTSRIRYFAPTIHVAERLRLYGIRPENIFTTGFPLPKENLGSLKLEIVKKDLEFRILNLDPEHVYREKHHALIKEYLGNLPTVANRPFTILFSVGGAGAQTEIAVHALRSLKSYIQSGAVCFIISAGIKEDVKNEFIHHIESLGLTLSLGNGVNILFESSVDTYFKKFNEYLRVTDVLWTKPSELSFYCALGIPILIAPPLGSQEHFNNEWLLHVGAGIPHEDPRYADEWIFDLLKTGRFAEAAMEGFIDAEKRGTFQIEKILEKTKSLKKK